MVKEALESDSSASVCADCGNPATGNFCPACGQETRLEIPGIGRFIGEIASEQFGIEGRLGRTLVALLFMPGKLTQEFVAGRRQRYIRPARLYLSASVIFFAALSFTTALPSIILNSSTAEIVPGDSAAVVPGTLNPSDPDKDQNEAIKTSIKEALKRKDAKAALDGAPGEPATTANVSDAEGVPKKAAKTKVLPDSASMGETLNVHKQDLDRISTGNKALDDRIQARISELAKIPRKEFGNRLLRTLLDDAPVMMFFLLPLFAACLKLFYILRGLRYGVHLLFAVHFHSFVFLDLLARMLPWPHQVKDLFIFIIPVYLGLAMRRLYRSGVFSILLRMLALLIINSISMSILCILAVIFSIGFGLE